MAKSSSTVQLTPTEVGYINRVLEEEREWFANPVGWPETCPDTINLLSMYWFGMKLFAPQLAMYYCPRPEATIIGGRGCAKTTAVALAAGLWVALHPGEDWLHTAPSLDQAKKAKQILEEAGTRRALAPRTFFETFVEKNPDSPLPTIQFKSWDLDIDPGSWLYYRSATDNVERLRSYEVSVITGDEAFRDIKDVFTWQALRGCARGINRVFYNALEPEIKELVDSMLFEWASVDPPRKKLIEEQIKAMGLEKRNMMMLMGNAGDTEWSWERFDKGFSEPEHYWSIRLTTYDNPFLTQQDRENLERTFEDNPEMRDVEMLGMRPVGLGNIFPLKTIKMFTRRELNKEILGHVRAGHPGWTLHRHPPYGIVEMAVPFVPGHRYCLGADPGTDVVPKRNSWAIMVFDVTEPPAKMVFFQWGYIGQSPGKYDPFLQLVKAKMDEYHIISMMAAVDATAQAKGIVELAFAEDVRIWPISFKGMKPALINWCKNLMASGKMVGPHIEGLFRQLSNYVEKDKNIPQDLVCTLMLASAPIQLLFGGMIQPASDEMVEYDKRGVMQDREKRNSQRDFRRTRR